MLFAPSTSCLLYDLSLRFWPFEMFEFRIKSARCSLQMTSYCLMFRIRQKEGCGPHATSVEEVAHINQELECWGEILCGVEYGEYVMGIIAC